MCFEGKWLQNQLQADKKELRSLLVVDIQGHQSALSPGQASQKNK